MSYRDVWQMAQGRLQAQRAMVISQAALVWCLGKMTPDNLQDFILTGRLNPEGDDRQKVKWRPGLLRQMIHGGTR